MIMNLKDILRTELVKLDILLNGDVVDALSMIVPEERAYHKGRGIAEKLKGNYSKTNV